jgi:hypothetical protein
VFITDRDLLLIEPGLTRDVGWAGSRLLAGIGDVAGTTLTLTSQDLDFDEANVDEGHIVSVGSVAYEVIERLTSTTATISRLRVAIEDPVQAPSPGSDLPVEVFSFAPQISMIHAQVLRLLGIDPDDPAEDEPTEEDITNPGALKRVEALGTLHLIFAAAAALGEPGSSVWARAEMYRDRFAAERRRAAARIDLDGDGIADATRRLNLVQLTRA